MLLLSILLSCSSTENKTTVDPLEKCRVECDNERSEGWDEEAKRDYIKKCEKIEEPHMGCEKGWILQFGVEESKRKPVWRECLADCKLRYD